MRRFLAGLFFVVHGLAHAAPGMEAQDASGETVRVALATILFFVATPGFVTAGLGVWGVAGLERHWRAAVEVAAVGSALLLTLAWRGIVETSLGLTFDVAALVVAETSFLSEEPLRPRRHGHAFVQGAALLFLAYVSVLVFVRPWHRDWGATPIERARPLPGDEHAGSPWRAGDRAIPIAAPARDVWSWLLQMGEDRGGFYSYASLENLFGLHIVNADRIVPQWQRLATGDFVRAVPPRWMGGAFGERVGWEVDHVDHARHVLSLRYWIFEVEPVDATRSRLHVRTHAGDAPVPVAPLLMLTFEPAHFIMERAMLFGVKARAERLAAGQRTGAGNAGPSLRRRNCAPPAARRAEPGKSGASARGMRVANPPRRTMSTNSAAPAEVEHPESAPDAPFTDHEYDGIKEYDNPMPRWWVWTFWGSFYFAVCYLMWNHVYMRGTPIEEEWAADMRTARQESARRELGTISEESLQKLADNGAVMADARATFSKRCVECHGPRGEGVIGPNLTDDYWLHGKASFMDIYGVIKDGVPAKGMPAWGRKLDPVEVAKLAAFVGTIRGQHLQGKAPEGTLLATVAPPAK